MRLLSNLISRISECFVSITCFLMAFQVNAGQCGNFNPIIPTSIQTEQLHGVGNPTINDAHVDLFANNVYHVSQQEGSMLMPFVLVEGMVMNAKQIQRIGSLPDPALYKGRGSKVTATNPVNDNRWLTAQRYWHACFVDNWDQVRTLWDIRNAYSQAMAMSFGRLMDRVIIAAALGTVWAGPQRTNPIALPDNQKIAATDGTAFTGANLDLLMNVRTTMKKRFAAVKGQSIIMVITADESRSLLNESKLTNRDYTTILALMSGEISAFYGIIFVETQLIPKNSTAFRFAAGTGRLVSVDGVQVAVGAANRCFAFISGDTLCFGINQNMLARVSERDDLHFNIQIYYAAEFGAVRKEEVKVMECLTEAIAA